MKGGTRRDAHDGESPSGMGVGCGRRFAALLSLLLLAPVANAARAADSAVPPPSRTLRNRPQLLGELGGLRPRLSRLGVTLQLFSNHFGGEKWRGGAEGGADTGHSTSVDAFAVADLEEVAGWRGGTLLLHLKSQYDRSVNEAVGALSDPIDDADFDEALYVDELWFQQALASGRIRLRAGFQEQQTIFDRNAFANSEDRQFMATALDNDPLVPLPNGLAVNAILEVAPWLELAVGVADAENVPRRSGFHTAFDDSDSLSSWIEATLSVKLSGPAGELPGSLRLGAFRDGRKRVILGGDARRRGHRGVYLSADQLLWREAGGTGRSLGLFARGGLADEDVVAFPYFWSGGLAAAGLVPGRREDVLGLGVHQRIASSRARETTVPDAQRETGFEIYYAAAVLPWLTVTPDVQVLLDPGGASTKTAVLATLRARVAW